MARSSRSSSDRQSSRSSGQAGDRRGEVDVSLTYWQPVMKDLKKAHPDIAWQGHQDTPFVRALFKLAPGAVRVESGGDKRARWLRVVR